jgi:hypothetical protein
VNASSAHELLPELVSLAGPRRVEEGEQGVLALQWPLPSGLPVVPQPPEGVRVVRRGPARAPSTRGGGAERPEPGAWVARLVQAVVEVLAGDRPLLQLMRWLDIAVYERLAEHVTNRAGRPPGARPGPVRAVRSVHLCEPRAGVVEAAVVVGSGARVRAVAVRLEGARGRWRCTRLTIL